MQETLRDMVWSLDQEDPMEEEMATHSSILTWRIPWTEEPGGLQPMGSQKSQTWLKQLSTHILSHCFMVKFHVFWVKRETLLEWYNIEFSSGMSNALDHFNKPAVMIILMGGLCFILHKWWV